ncbi:hypothetical protein [Fulvimonas yonginensis]|uniref:Energy transducer TonB n=1 Tax=Fulvimonas yonginensis TaxID=1495200 RepID=A0ABU8J821_9GAMM
MSVFLASSRRRLQAGGAVLILLLAALAVPAWRNASAVNTADADSSGRGILLSLADEAVREHRLVAPAGRNAYEFYLSVLELAPDDAQTREALLRLFPAATAAVEQAIDRGELDEAERELRLLREFDSGNYLLALLAGKLDAQRQVLVRQHEARAKLIQARLARQAAAAQPAR